MIGMEYLLLLLGAGLATVLLVYAVTVVGVDAMDPAVLTAVHEVAKTIFDVCMAGINV